MHLIYCAGKNPTFEAIARSAGYLIGVCLPNSVSPPIFFADQNWKRPDRSRYMAALAQHRPRMATVLDLERPDQLSTVLDWAEEASQYAQQIVVIPKHRSAVATIPRRIGSADIVLGYSIPTRYGGTDVPIWEFAGWPIHLLGGSPKWQMHYYEHLSVIAEVVSADGNYHQMKAVCYCQYWQEGRWIADGWTTHDDAPRACFARSCQNLVHAWRNLVHAWRKNG